MPRFEGATPEVASVPNAEGFRSPEEELAYLRERVRIKEKELEHHPTDFERDRLARREIMHYQDTPTADVLNEKYAVSESTMLRETLRLEPDEHDTQIDELLRMVPERGIKNTLAIMSKMGSAHLEDDLHRALVQYVAHGLPTPQAKQGTELWRALHMTLYEVSLPASTSTEQQAQTDIERLLATMEQFYAGMLSVVGSGQLGKKDVFTVEMAVHQGSEEAIFYVSVPKKRRELFEKHLISIFPNAQLEEVRGDYNIFNYGGAHAGAYGVLEKSPAYPLKPYSEFVHDPLNVMLSAFSNLSKHNEGAAIQFVIGENGDTYNRQYKKVIDHLRKGESAHKSIKYGTQPFAETLDTIGSALFSSKDTSVEKEKVVDETTLNAVSSKIHSRIIPVNIRILSSAKDEERANDIIENLASTFNQFENAEGNALRFQRVHGGALRKLLHSFTFRLLNMKFVQPLSLSELTAMCHLTGEGVSTSRELKQSRAKQVAAPLEVASERTAAPEPVATTPTPTPQSVPSSGIILGKNSFGGSETFVNFLPEDRMRHFYEIGQTGTGKTSLMVNMIIQDIRNGEGCCYIDPHGSDIVDILAAIPPERRDDVIYFDPAHTQRPMGLNIMEFNPDYPEQKTFVVNEIFSIFEKLFLAKSPESLGPMFEQYFRNAALLVLEGMPTGTATMADIPRVLANTQFRRECIANSQNPTLNQFWTDIAQQAGGEASLENIVPYITAKTDIFLSNEIMRPILSQSQSAFNFRDIMDNKKILLVNLSKGRLGDLNSELLGLIIVGKFLQAALSRVDAVTSGQKPSDFYLYIDEFQNFTTPSIATILSEARKYRLSLHVAHQFIAQLDERIRDAVFGNVGTKCVFRVSSEDAEFLAKQFEPDFTASDIMGLDNFNAYMALLVNGKPIRPFNMQTIAPEKGDMSQVEELKQLSYQRYGRERSEIDAELNAKFAPPQPPSAQYGNSPL